MRPTPGVAAVVAMAVVLHLLARTTGVAWLALGAGALLALPLAAVLLRPRLGGVVVTSEPVRVRVGDEVGARLRVRNTGRRATPPLRLVDRTPGLAEVTVAVGPLGPGQDVSAIVRRRALRRGHAAAGEAVLSGTSPIGLVRAQAKVTVSGPFVVAPRRVPSPGPTGGGTGEGSSARPVAGPGTEVLGLRPWRPGDGAASLSARASARHGRPVVLERERDSGSTLVVLCAGPGSGPAWEAGVEAACSLAEQAVQRGRPPVLLAAGTPPLARPSREAVLDWHARLDAAGPLDAATTAAAVRAAGPGGTVVLLTATRAPAVARACTAAGASVTVLGLPG